MTLDVIYRDVFSNIRLFNLADEIREKDIINAINQAIRKVRNEYVKNDLGHFFSYTETVNSLSEDSDYNFLKSGSLSKVVSSEAPIENVVLEGNVSITSNEIQNSSQTFSEGDIAFLGDSLYEAVRDITNENTFTSTFDATEVRLYKINNGLKYFEGDIVYNIDDSKYYKVTTTFTAENGTENLDEVVWRKLGNSYITTVCYPIDSLRQILLHSFERQAICVNKDKVYTNDNVDSITLTYIPEWEDVTTKASELNIPESIVPLVINDATNKILRKLNVPVEDEPTDRVRPE